MPNYQKFYLNQNIDLKKLFPKLSQEICFVFLQDDAFPVIGLIPKVYYSSFLQYSREITDKEIKYVQSPYPTDALNQVLTGKKSVVNDEQGFSGGYISFFSYEFCSNYILNNSNQVGGYFVGEYDIFIKHINNEWILYIENSLCNLLPIKNLIHLITKKIQNTSSLIPPCFFKAPFTPRWSKHDYQYAFSKVQDYLYAGDCYQINLTQEFSSKISSGKILSLLPELMNLTRAPYAGYLAFDDFELLSCSPELFIEFSENRLLKTRPIKGTLPRSCDPIEDAKLKQQLADSEKDQAENLMIVDLLRNDLSIYAETGSVEVPKLFEIESFAQVHHMVSEIHAILKPDVNPFDVLISALPGGSITGAPKIRAMEIIDEIEGNNRGAYCGSLGYFNYDGTGAFNILIRSIQRYGDDVSVWAGGGITVKSDVDAEYQETLDKVSAILDVLNQYVE